MKVFTAVPCGELSRYSEFWCLMNRIQLPAGSPVLSQCRGVYICGNQNALARDFLKTDCDFFWLTNDDQAYGDDVVFSLLKAFDRTDIQVDIVVPLCLQHDPPHAPLLYDKREGDNYGPYLLEKGVSGLVPVLGSGGGGMLIRRKVFETIPDPWFDQHMVYNDPPTQSTEDLVFCSKVIDYGFKIWGDLDTVVGHYTNFNVSAIQMPDGEWQTAYIRHTGCVMTPAASLKKQA